MTDAILANAVGEDEGAVCARSGCSGIICLEVSENCSCHINPPCGSCTSVKSHCPACGWVEPDVEVINDYTVKIDRKSGQYLSWEPRPLDNSKIDWRSHAHSNSSMLKEGVYPEGTTREDVRREVDGTFGGRFEAFGDGKFRFIAYTD